MSRRSESQIQQAVIKWFALAHKGLGVPAEHLLFAVPNGGMRDKVTAAILKGEGVRPGVSDLFLAVPVTECLNASGWWHGLFIEMKTWEGRLQSNQAVFLNDAARHGYATAVCHGFDQATRTIEAYMRGRFNELPASWRGREET